MISKNLAELPDKVGWQPAGQHPPARAADRRARREGRTG